MTRAESKHCPALLFRTNNSPTYTFIKHIKNVTFIEVERWHADLNDAIHYFREVCGKGFDVVDADDYNSYYFVFADKEDAMLLKLKYAKLLYGAKQ